MQCKSYDDRTFLMKFKWDLLCELIGNYLASKKFDKGIDGTITGRIIFK